MNDAQAMHLTAEALGVQPLYATHQAFGHNSVTFDVALPGRNVILRTNADPQVFATTERNLTVLAGLGLPVPTIIASDLTRARFPFAYLILNKIPGHDLRYELSSMTAEQMSRLAEQIVGFQRRVMRLPPGSGYGFVGIGEKAPFASFQELIRADNDRQTAQAPETAKHLAKRWQTRIEERMAALASYFRALTPTCFLDDITVKNVIVQNGELQGLVDFDCVCYGDPLYWLALTATGVVSDTGTRSLFYVQELKRLWGLTPEQEEVLALYSAGMALNFICRLSESETPEWHARMLMTVEEWMNTAK